MFILSSTITPHQNVSSPFIFLLKVPTTVEPTTPEPTDEPTSLEPTLSPPPTDTLTPDPTTPQPTTDEPTTTPPSPWPTEMATDEGTDCDDDDDDKWGGGKGWGCDKHHDDDDDDWSGSSVSFPLLYVCGEVRFLSLAFESLYRRFSPPYTLVILLF